MSQALLRMRKLGLGALYAYWTVAGVVGTLTITSAVTHHFAHNERSEFARQMLEAFRLGQRVELCSHACFTQDHQTYMGIQILPDKQEGVRDDLAK
jgi:hypothetical protein